MITGRRIAAFVTAPLVGAAVFYGIWLWAVGAKLSQIGIGLPVFFGIPTVVGLVAEIVFGVPLLLWLTSRRRLSPFAFALGGLAIGLAILLVFHPFGPLPRPVGIALCLIPSTTASIFFGYIGGWFERTGFAGRSAPSR